MERERSRGADVGVVVFAKELKPLGRKAEERDPVLDLERGGGRLVCKEVERLEGDRGEELIRGLPACPRRRRDGEGRPFSNRFGEGREERESGEPIRWGRPPELGGRPAEGGRPAGRNGGEFSERRKETP